MGITLKPSTDMGRLSAELSGAWNLKPYWGKPAVRNFRGGGWKRGHGSRTEAHFEMRGIATGPYAVVSTKNSTTTERAYRIESRVSWSEPARWCTDPTGPDTGDAS